MARDTTDHSRVDAVTVLTVYLVLVFAIPAQLVFAPLGEAGRPSRIFGLALLAWWLLDAVRRPTSGHSRLIPAAKVGVALFALAMAASYLAATVRPISAVELSSADRALLAVLSWLGVFLVAADGIPSVERLYDLLERIALGVGLFASLGILQFVAGSSLLGWMDFPGLKYLSEGVGVAARAGYLRPAATAIHPIEFGAVLGLGLAIALFVAVDLQRRGTALRWFPPMAVALAIPVSGSRSAFISGAVVAAMLVPTWARPLRHNAYVVIALAVAGSVVAAPSFLRSMYRLFAGIGTDDSTTSRTGSYDLALYLIAKYPVFGRGLGTFLSDYRILDNQYLGTIIEAGFVGLSALVLVFVFGIATGEKIRRSAPDGLTQQLGRALSASIAATGISWLFYDGLGFPINAGMAFLVLGVTSAGRRLQSGSSQMRV